MRQGYGDREFPAKPGEPFLSYIHRLAQYLGHIPADVPPPHARKRARRHGGPGFMERLDSIFGVKREPGEDR